MQVIVSIVLPLAAVAVTMLTAAGCLDSLGCPRLTAEGAFIMLLGVSCSSCWGVDDPFAVGMSCCIFLITAGALMPVVVSIVLPLAAVAVSMLTAAGCLDSFGCHRITADGAFLML